MTSRSGIEWTEATWNPVCGCSRVSTGCKDCYALRIAHRLASNPKPKIAAIYDDLTLLRENGQLDWTGVVRLVEERLVDPLLVKRPTMFFVNSMSDCFHEALDEFSIQLLFTVMRKADWHTFQILTKRSARLREVSVRLPWPSNVWMGVSVENAAHTARVDALRATPAHVKFLSLEPLLGALPNLDLSGINWVILGGESGPGARPMNPSWVRDLRDQCVTARVPFFFKQWGGVHKKAAGRVLDGRTWDDMPVTASHGPEAIHA